MDCQPLLCQSFVSMIAMKMNDSRKEAYNNYLRPVLVVKVFGLLLLVVAGVLGIAVVVVVVVGMFAGDLDIVVFAEVLDIVVVVVVGNAEDVDIPDALAVII